MGASLLSASALLLAGCGREEAATNRASGTTLPAAESDTVVFRAGARDRLCLTGGQVAFITYAEGGNTNCTVRGSVDGPAAETLIHPDGDTACTVPLTRAENRVTLGAGGPACAYYCGPNAGFAGKSFDRAPTPEAVTDLAGDPLC